LLCSHSFGRQRVAGCTRWRGIFKGLPKSGGRVSFETSFDSKQPKLEPKLVSALSETKRLFRLFRFYIETASFGVSIEPKQTEDQPKQTETKRNKSNMKNI